MARKQQAFEKPYVAAIVAAAGASTRMAGTDKLFEDVAGAPLLMRTLAALAASEWLDELVVVTSAAHVADVHAMVRAYGLGKVRSVVAGGSTRQQSVARGLAAVSPQTAYIAVHDGARPFVERQIIADAVISAIRYGAAAAAVPVTDTVKQADAQHMVTATPPRDTLFAMQTPQIFEASLYRAALETALARGNDYTDDCQLMEATGQMVYLSQGSQLNFKVTHPLDLALARLVIEQEELP